MVSGLTRTLRCRGLGGCKPRSATTAWWSSRSLPRRPFTTVKVSSLAEALLLASTTCSCSCGWGPVARFAAAAISGGDIAGRFFLVEDGEDAATPACFEESTSEHSVDLWSAANARVRQEENLCSCVAGFLLFFT
ncbi:hypothetical protein TKK_0009556 [Trichogramma kaykai]